jgi:hypothetical protein
MLAAPLAQAAEITLVCQSRADINGLKGNKVDEYTFTVSADRKAISSGNNGKSYILNATDMAYEWEWQIVPNGALVRSRINRVTGRYEDYFSGQLISSGICNTAATKF